MHRHRLPRAVLVAIALALALPATAVAEEAPRVGVVVAMAVNVDDERAERLAGAMGAALNRELIVDVIAGAEARRRLPAAGLDDECVADTDCLIDVARRLDADELLMLVVIRVDDSVQIDPTWFDLATGKTVSRSAIHLDANETDVGDVFAEHASRMLPAAKRRPKDSSITSFQFGAGGSVQIVKEPRRMTRPAWIAGGVGVAALAGSIAVGLSTRSKYRDIEADCGGPCPLSHPRYDELSSVDNRALVADALLGAAVVSGATAAILYLRSGGERRVEPPAVSLGAGPDGVAVTMGGRF